MVYKFTAEEKDVLAEALSARRLALVSDSAPSSLSDNPSDGRAALFCFLYELAL